MNRIAKVLLCCAAMQLLSGRALSRRPLIRAPRGTPTTGRYTVMLKQGLSKAECSEAVAMISKAARVYGRTEKVVQSLTVDISPYVLENVRHLNAVNYIEEEGIAKGTQDERLMWYLDRIDQFSLPLDYHYSPIGGGEGVDVYILDSGINYDHDEFESRAKYAGYDAVDAYESFGNSTAQLRKGRDCHGHGTHVASLCGGKTFGAAKKVMLYSLRVLRCDNSAPWSVVLDGLDNAAKLISERKRPAVISMSLGGGYHQAINDMLQAMEHKGFNVVVAAGNGKSDACRNSPASSPHVITVGGTRDGDNIYDYGSGTNYGRCVDVFAPGQSIKAADYLCANCSVTFSGTSMSTPLVSGVAAVYLSRQPLLSVTELKEKIVSESVEGKIDFMGIPVEYWTQTPNRLLQVPGSCGSSLFVLSEGVISSPNYPSAYSDNLHCLWIVGALEGQEVEFNLTFVQLEEQYDSLTVYDGDCCAEGAVLVRLTGNHGRIFRSFRSTGTTLSIELKTDGTVGKQGFKGRYTKQYRNTQIKVPDTPIEYPSTKPCCEVEPVPVFVSLFGLRTRNFKEEIEPYLRQGFNMSWLTAYRSSSGSRINLHFGVILNNSTQLDSVAFRDLSPEVLRSKIAEMNEKGYSVKYISDRFRGGNTICSYSIVFVPTDDIIDTEVFLQDSIATHEQQLATKTADRYVLRSISLCDLTPVGGIVEVATVYTRDRRIAAGIPIDDHPKWISYHNLTFYDFTEVTLRHVREKMYPTYVESYYLSADRTRNSYFSVVLEEQSESDSGWFRWGLNYTEAVEQTKTNSRSWVPCLITGYNYQGRALFFVKFGRKPQS